MSAARRLPRKLLLVSISVLLILTLTTPVWAQYSIPDCLVAAINGMLPDEGFAAARDENYKKDSATWNSETAGLTPEQLQGYRTYFCANFSVSDQGADADGGHNILVNWPTVDGYLQTIGQRRGQGGSTGETTGGTGGSTGSTGSTGSSGSTGTSGTSGTTGSGGKLSAGNTVATIADVNPADLLFDASFDSLPDNLEIRDADDKLVDGTLTTDAKDTVLKIEADANRTLTLISDDASTWTDYALEARVKVTDGTLLLSTRTDENGCSSYDFYVDPGSSYGSIEKSDKDCNETTVQDRSDLSTVKANKWVTLRLNNAGDQLTASVNGEKVLSGTDSSYTQGYPALYLFPDDGKTATLEIDSLRVITTHAAPDTLADYAKSPAEAIAELQSLGQVPTSKGTLIFQQKSAFASGSGFHFYAMAPRSPRTDVVISATLKFKAAGSGDDSEYCALTARLSASGGGSKSVVIGFDNQGYLTLADADSSSDSGASIISAAPDYPPGQSYNLLVTLIGQQAVIYVDGQRVLATDQLVAHDGSYALVLLGTNGSSRCDATNFWAYSFK